MSEIRADKNMKTNFSKRDFRNQGMERDDDNDADDEMPPNVRSTDEEFGAVSTNVIRKDAQTSSIAHPSTSKPFNLYAYRTASTSCGSDPESDESENSSSLKLTPLAKRTIPDTLDPSTMDYISSVFDSLCVGFRFESRQSEQNAPALKIAHDVPPSTVCQPSVSAVPERDPRLPRLPPSVPTARISPHNYNIRTSHSMTSILFREPEKSMTVALPSTNQHLPSAARPLLSDGLSLTGSSSVRLANFYRTLHFPSGRFDQNYSLSHQSVSGSMNEFDPNDDDDDEDISTIGTRSSSRSIPDVVLPNSSSNQYEWQTPIRRTSRHQDSTSSSTNQCESGLSGVMCGSITQDSANSSKSEVRDGKERSVKDQTTDSPTFDLGNVYSVVPPNRTVKDINTPVVPVHSQSTSATSSKSVPDPEPTRSSTSSLAPPSISTTGSEPAKVGRKPMSFQEFLDIASYEPEIPALNVALSSRKRRLDFDSEQPSGEITEMETALFKEKGKLDEDERDEKRSGRKRRSNQPTDIPPDSENDEAKSKKKSSLSQPEQTAVDSEPLDDSDKKV